MTRNEVLHTLTAFAAAWPTFPLEEPTVELWCNALADCDNTAAVRATARLVTNEEWFPSVARFRAEVRAVAGGSDLPGLPPGRANPEHVARMVAEARRHLGGAA